MARGPNPYYADAGKYNGVADSVNNLGAMFLGTQGAGTRAKNEALAWQARDSREGVIDTQDARAGRQSMGDMFANYSPDTYSPQQVLGAGISSGAYEPGDLGTLFQVAAGNLPDMTDEQRQGAAFGNGDFIGQNDAVSLDHQERIRQANAGVDIDKARNEGFTLSPGQQRFDSAGNPIAAVAPKPGSEGTGQAVQYLLKDGTKTYGTFNNQTGYLDDAGRPISIESVEHVARIGTPTGTNDDLGLGTTATNAAQGRLAEIESGLTFVNRLEGMVDDPTNFGSVGFLKRTVQDAIQQGDALAQYFGESGREIQKDIMKNGYDVSIDNFDKDLSQLDMARNLLAYKMASALAGQSGRGLSDNDFKRFRSMFARGGPFSIDNRADFASRLELTRELLQDERGVNSALLRRGVDGGGRSEERAAPARPSAPDSVGDMFGGQGGPTPRRPQEAADPIVDKARSAIQQGADPAAVRGRLLQNGYTEAQLEGMGL